MKHTLCLVGNPNCGKTTLFNALTGSKQRVGNWAGVTVEKKTGEFSYRGIEFDLVDLPGIYSLTPCSAAGDDEIVARDYLVSGEAQLIINIVDASNLERNLYLTTQLLELKLPMILVVNMLDIAKQHHVTVDLEALQKQLGVPTVGIIASREKGLHELKNCLIDCLSTPIITSSNIIFNEEIQKSIEQITTELKQKHPNGAWFASQFLERAPGLNTCFDETTLNRIQDIVDEIDSKFQGNLDIEIANARYDFIHKLIEHSVKRENETVATLTDRIDHIILNRWLGLPIFLFIMYAMFLFTQNFGAIFIDFFDILVGGIFVDGLSIFLSNIGTPQWLTVFLSNGIGGGLQTISTFIPVVFFMFLFLAILEESGYMARAAFVMDRLMRYLGLPGKAFVPLIVGFGCNVPSIMATRTMDRASDRILTVMMAPFMSCGARLPVYVLFATAFFPTNGQNLVFLLYLIGIVAAIATGFLLKRTALPGEASTFVMEMPPYHIPTLKGIFLKTWDRVRSFMFRAGRVIVIIVACLSFLNSLGTDGSFGNEDSQNSVLSKIGQTIVPIFEPIGVEEQNWPAAVGVFTGIFAKEAVVGTLNSLYDTLSVSRSNTEEPVQEDSDFSILTITSDALSTIKENFFSLGSAFYDPLGIQVDDLSLQEQAAENQGVSLGTIATIQTLFGSSTAAFAYLLMILLYMPCVAAIGAIYREVGAKWTLFSAAWTTVLGYSTATVVFQISNLSSRPIYALTCISISLVALTGMVYWMKKMANKEEKVTKNKSKRIIPIIPVS